MMDIKRIHINLLLMLFLAVTGYSQDSVITGYRIDGDELEQVEQDLSFDRILNDKQVRELLKAGGMELFIEYQNIPTTKNLNKLARVLVEVGMKSNCDELVELGNDMLLATETFKIEKSNELENIIVKLFNKL